MLYDDTGLAAWSPYGGRINMPTMHRLADNGLTYSQWHTTALCSPTRSTFLTGRNHHVNRLRGIMEGTDGFPGAAGRLPAECATIGQVLQDNGYSTFWLGQEPQRPRGGHRRGRQPVGVAAAAKGFDRFYGFLGGETNNWYPDLVEDNHFIDQPYPPEEGYHLSKDLADQAIRMLRDQKASNPSKPWFMWFCPGANHAPHHAPKEYIDKYKGKFDDGYEAYREWVLARMIEKGILPEGTELTPLNPLPEEVANPADVVRPWDTLNDDEKRLFARMAEVFAGFSEYTDAQVGRIIDYLEQTGQLDNTLVFYCADNGASGEGTPERVGQREQVLQRLPRRPGGEPEMLDKLGSPDTYNHYPTGWAAAFSTPFQMFKRYSQYSGGTCDPMVIHWPKGIKAQRRGPPPVPPRHRHRRRPSSTSSAWRCRRSTAASSSIRSPASRCATASTSADAPTTKKRQYYAMLGTRGIWQDGWKAAALHAPISGKGHFDQDALGALPRRRGPFGVEEPRGRAPGEAAGADQGLVRGGGREPRAAARRPDRRSSCSPSSARRPSRRATATSTTPAPSPVPEGVAVNVRGRSYKIIADVEPRRGRRRA